VTAPIGSGRLRAKGLTKRFGPVAAVEDLTFAVEPGTVTGFRGPNGSGKTTTLRMLLGLVAPTEGEALVEGVPYRVAARHSSARPSHKVERRSNVGRRRQRLCEVRCG